MSSQRNPSKCGHCTGLKSRPTRFDPEGLHDRLRLRHEALSNKPWPSPRGLTPGASGCSTAWSCTRFGSEGPRFESGHPDHAADRECLSIEANGAGLWWPSLDEDLSVRGLVRDYAKSRTSLSRTPGKRRAATLA